VDEGEVEVIDGKVAAMANDGVENSSTVHRGVSEVCDHVEFLGEEVRSEWLTGDDESMKMALVALFTVRWGKVEILRAHWFQGRWSYGGERRCWCASILGVGWG
jgi:hypothetical protein